MKGNNINQELQRRKFFSNRSIKIFDESMVMGLVFSISLWWFCEPKISANALSCIFFGMTILALIFYKILATSSLRKSTQYIEKTYKGNINELILAMYSNGLVLNGLGNNFYIFKTDNKIMPNEQFVIKDYVEYCSVLGHEASLRRLQNSLCLSEK